MADSSNRRREPSMAESGPLHPIEGARRSRRIRGFGRTWLLRGVRARQPWPERLEAVRARVPQGDARRRAVDRFPWSRPVRLDGDGARGEARKAAAPGVFSHERRRMRRRLDLGSGPVRGAPSAGQPRRDRRLQQDPEPRTGRRHAAISSRSPTNGAPSAGRRRGRRPRPRGDRALPAAVPPAAGKPTCVIAHTIKGKGCQLHGELRALALPTARGDEFEGRCAHSRERREGRVRPAAAGLARARPASC